MRKEDREGSTDDYVEQDPDINDFLWENLPLEKDRYETVLL